MIKAGMSLTKGIAAARAIFGLRFQPSESLKALVYYNDGDLATLTNNEKNTLIKAVSAVSELPDISILCRRLTRITERGKTAATLNQINHNTTGIQ